MRKERHNMAEETGGGDLWVVVTTQRDEHDGHKWERTESLYDNAVEFTVWGYCDDCRTEFMVESWGLV